MSNPEVKIHLLPRGIMPERKSEGAIGYDVCIRAIVSPDEMDLVNPDLRKTLFDFETIPNNLSLQRHIVELPRENGGSKEFAYQLNPGESVLAGIGFLTAMSFPMFYWVVPRSGLASKHGIQVTNAPGIVDPDYRGEAGVLVHNRPENKKPFFLRYGMRIAQIVFQYAVIPEFTSVKISGDLPETLRGTGGFGSTGLL